VVDGADRRDGSCSIGYRSASVPLGAAICCLFGLTPLQKSSGGKERLGRITKMGDKYLRKLLVVGMTALELD
jgi:transposase